MTKYFMVLAFSLPSELCRSFVTTLRSSKLSVGRYSRDCDGLDIHYIVGHCPKQKNENIYTGIFQRKSLMTKHFFALYSDRKKSHRHTDFLICLFGATAQIVTYKRMRTVMWKYCHNHFRLIDWLIDWLIDCQNHFRSPGWPFLSFCIQQLEPDVTISLPWVRLSCCSDPVMIQVKHYRKWRNLTIVLTQVPLDSHYQI